MSLRAPKTPHIIKQMVLLGYSRDGTPKDLCDAIAQEVSDHHGFYSYVFACTGTDAWAKANAAFPDFDVAAVGGIEVAALLLQRWLASQTAKNPHTLSEVLLLNLASSRRPIVTTRDVLSIYGSEENLNVASSWSNKIGSRHHLEIVMGADSSFAGHFTEAAQLVATQLTNRRPQIFYEASRVVARTPRTKRIEGVDLVRDAGYPPIMSGQIYRATNLIGITRAGKNQLRKLGISLIVDLRQPAQRQGQVPTIDGISVAHIADIKRAAEVVVGALGSRTVCLVFSSEPEDTAKVFTRILHDAGVDQRTIELDATLDDRLLT